MVHVLLVLSRRRSIITIIICCTTDRYNIIVSTMLLVRIKENDNYTPDLSGWFPLDILVLRILYLYHSAVLYVAVAVAVAVVTY
mmetsp:Transcript_17903/g.19663  ORF Transcript_17903/g.19663 Transcript_17903/m.19663 type:complete len:84 (+) Transcript_17903:194-445(+)